MKIVKLTAENVKKLRAIEITPAADMVAITGKNGQGKTSVLDAIWWALAGTKHIQAVPIRKGSDKARIRLDLGELVVERRFTAAGSTLIVENADGSRYKSPQSMLDALLGALTFDPLAFVNQDPKQQFDTLRRIVKMDIDFDQIDGLNRRDFEQRTEVNRNAKQQRAQADGITVPADLPEAAIDTAALMDQMASAAKVNAEIETRRGRREQAVRDIETWRQSATDARTEAARLRKMADNKDALAVSYEQQADANQQKLDDAEPLPEAVDVDALRLSLNDAQTINRQIEQRTRKASLIAEAERLEAQSRDLTETMEARNRTKADAIAKAEMPVTGLGFGEGIVTFGGVPFEQASSAEQLKVSVAIAMAANPKLRVIRIKEGSLLDEANLALVSDLAQEHDYQVWIERVDTTGKVGIVIDDGMVVAVDGEPVTAPADEAAA